MIFEMEPLAEAELRRVRGEGIEGWLRRPVLPQQPHVEMAVIGGSLGLAMPRCRSPGARQIAKAVPMDARCAAFEQLGGAIEAPGLYLLGPEGGDADLGDPDRQVRHRLDLTQ